MKASLRSGALMALMLAAPGGLDGQNAVSVDSLRSWMQQVSNRGRWGEDDERGTLNLITPARRQAATATVTEGVTISLAHDLISGPNPNALQPLEVQHLVAPLGTTTAALDRFGIMYHGWAYSHLDALSHFAFDSTFYNGNPLGILGEAGAEKLAIDAMADGIVGRGILIDVPRLRGVDFLEPEAFVTVADFEAWEARVGVRVSEGDILLVRTGRWARETATGPWSVRESSAGLHPSVALWLNDRGVAALGGDAANDRTPSIVEGIGDPLHQLAIVAMGMPLFDNLDLEHLAVAAAAHSRWSFLFVASPLRLKGASGSPVNPLAIF
jgi:kynurenine formamidase